MKQKLFWAMLPFMALSFVSCEDEEAFDSDVGSSQSKREMGIKEGEIRLGEKINSPVTLRSCLNFITELILSFTLFFLASLKRFLTYFYYYLGIHIIRHCSLIYVTMKISTMEAQLFLMMKSQVIH